MAPFLLLLALSALASAIPLGQTGASAFFTMHSGPLPPEVVYYSVDQSFRGYGLSVDRLHDADNAIAVQDLALSVRFVDDVRYGYQHYVRAAAIDGPYGVAASESTSESDDHCKQSTFACVITFDYRETWNNSSSPPTGSQVDLMTAAMHEMGHFAGLEHSGDQPSSDPRPPLMSAVSPYGVERRSLPADDASGLKTARGGSYINMVANSSLEFSSPFLGTRLLSSGNIARYCSGSVDGACFLQFNGNGAAGASVYQDVHDYVGPGTAGENAYPWHRNQIWLPSVMVRTPSGGSVDIALYFLDSGGGVSQRCTPPSGVWTRCYAPTFQQPGNNTRLRLQVYNQTTGNVAVDDLRLSRG